MLNFTFCAPTKFVFGRGAENQAGAMLTELGVRKVLIHYGGGSCVRSGLLARVEQSVQDAGIEYVTLGGAQPNPRSSLVRKGIDLIRREGVEAILAVGGGSVIDSSKAMAVGAVYDGDFWDFFCGKATPKAKLPLGVVLVTGEDAQAVMKLIQKDTKFTLNPYVDGEGAVQDFVPAVHRQN